MFVQKPTALEKIEFSFSEKINGVIWKTIADPSKKRLYLECRNAASKVVTFAALDLEKKAWLWKDMALDESWWISLSACGADVLFLSVYNNTNNPERTSLVAFDVIVKKVIWWKNNFTLEAIYDRALIGLDNVTGLKRSLAISDGVELSTDAFIGEQQNLSITRPFQYHEGTPHFETVRAFLEIKCNFSAVAILEYAEFGSFSIMSAFTGVADLANYLIVCNEEGDVLIKEALGERLKGIAHDTFFIFSGYLIFVKNKSELIVYKFL